MIENIRIKLIIEISLIELDCLFENEIISEKDNCFIELTVESLFV